jgi:hypothetical protein
MKYDIYFHNDLDGLASAALMLNFLRSRGDRIEHYVPVDFRLRRHWLKDNFFADHKLIKGKQNGAIVVDFLYHPKAVFWFDHHPTTFQRKDWRDNFKQSKYFNWNPKYKSCYSLVLDSLTKNFGYKPPPHLKKLALWLDVVDSADYKSIKQWMEMKEPALELDAFVDRYGSSPGLTTRFINELSTRPVSKIVKQPRIKRGIASVRLALKKAAAFYKKHTVQLSNRVIFTDFTSDRRGFSNFRFLAYYVCPAALYAIRLFINDDGLYHISVGVNPEKRRRNKIHLGRLMAHFSGGGGHKDVGAAEFNSKKTAENAVKKIAAKLK